MDLVSVTLGPVYVTLAWTQSMLPWAQCLCYPGPSVSVTLGPVSVTVVQSVTVGLA